MMEIIETRVTRKADRAGIQGKRMDGFTMFTPSSHTTKQQNKKNHCRLKDKKPEEGCETPGPD